MCGEHELQFLISCRLSGSSPHVRGAHSITPVCLTSRGIIPACAGSTRHGSIPLLLTRDHPRMCGEHGSFDLTGVAGTGSSPHVRGALSVGEDVESAIGDHPRMCGEHVSPKGDVPGLVGSSPHVRGALSCRPSIAFGRGIIPACAGSTLGVDVDCGGHFGIIPACAGSTENIDMNGASARDHPRMCGEHGYDQVWTLLYWGSSPHVRGAQVWSAGTIAYAGIIPACAGSTALLLPKDVDVRDHPRMCGEHLKPPASQRYALGSSPHVRGAPHSTAYPDTQSRDHPRMCGEHHHGLVLGLRAEGSSPHVRGAREGEFDAAARVGIIPACAGSTSSPLPASTGSRDHPRMCGEHWERDDERDGYRGSSPHVRGAPRIPGPRPPVRGIIPACAGSTRGAVNTAEVFWDHPRMCGEHSRSLRLSGRL